MDYEALDMDFESDACDGMMDVFTDDVMDDEGFTGGDWYAMALAAAHGGTAIHGVSFAPSCEVLAKCSLDFASKHAVGWIKVEDKPVDEYSVTGDEEGMYQASPPFRGIKTTSHVDLLADDAKWETSNATRAKHAAIVAATAESFGASSSDAVSFAEACVGGDIDPDIVKALVIPISILKRDAASMGKSNHTVYSRGVNQSRITWMDTSLRADALPSNAALDWARVTATARYIAEANAQLDPRFKEVSRDRGIPYALIRNCWAHVSSTDYTPRDADWHQIKALGESVPEVPSLKGYYAQAKDDAYSTLLRALTLTDSQESSSIFEALTQAMSAVRVKKPTKVHRQTTGTDLYASVASHQLSASAAAEKVADSGTSWKSLVKSYAAIALKDKESPTYKATEKLVLASRDRKMDTGEAEDALKEVTTRSIQADIWVMAQHLLSDMLQNPDTAERRMRSLYRYYVSSSADWEHPPRVGPFLLRNARTRVLTLAKGALLGGMPERPERSIIGSARAVTSLGAFSKLIHNARVFLEKSKVAWSERYQKLANLYGRSANADDKVKAIMFGVASKAFISLTPEALASPEAGYIIASKPADSYMWSVGKSYARKRSMTFSAVPPARAVSAKEIAEKLDEVLKPKVSFVECESFTREKVAMLAKDILEGIEGSLPNEEEPAEPKPAKPVVSMDQMAMLAKMQASMMFAASSKPISTVTLASVERSYPPDVDIEAYARANGFSSFSEAFDKLKDKAAYDPENEFTQKGAMAGAKEGVLKEHKEDTDGSMF